MFKKNLSLLVLSVFIPVYAVHSQQLPGVEIAYSNPETDVYLGSPSIEILEDGTYVASFDYFGYGSRFNETTIYRSLDRGESWDSLTTLQGQFWSNLFELKGALYLMGTSGRYGNLVIRKSFDSGETWTEPTNSKNGLLRDDEEYHTAPMPIVIHNGRIFRSMEDRNPPEEWGVNFRAFVISAPVDSDLLKASSWSVSNRLRYNQDWIGRAWLEGNIVKTPEGNLVNILRTHVLPDGGTAAIVEVSKYGGEVSFDPNTGFIDFPGGDKKFTIRFDAVTQRYWSLSNYVAPEFRGLDVPPERIRNTLTLVSSTDLREWEVNHIVLQHENVDKVGFQYVDWQFDGNDIVAVTRAAFPDENGIHADNQHNSNYIMFNRIKDFRNYIDTTID